MAQRIVAAVELPVTVKTRIGWGAESPMPIVDLARRLQDTGVAGLTIHCRTAQMGHEGSAEWSWAARAREAVTMPVVVNGDVRCAEDAVRALARRAAQGSWSAGPRSITPGSSARRAHCSTAPRRSRRATANACSPIARWSLANAAQRGEKFGVEVTRRHFGLLGSAAAPLLRQSLCAARTVASVQRLLDEAPVD